MKLNKTQEGVIKECKKLGNYGSSMYRKKQAMAKLVELGLVKVVTCKNMYNGRDTELELWSYDSTAIRVELVEIAEERLTYNAVYDEFNEEVMLRYEDLTDRMLEGDTTEIEVLRLADAVSKCSEGNGIDGTQRLIERARKHVKQEIEEADSHKPYYKKREVKQNWFPTLNDALESENLIETWDINYAGIAYGENFRYTTMVNNRMHHVSIFRETNGMYERPVHYDC